MGVRPTVIAVGSPNAHRTVFLWGLHVEQQAAFLCQLCSFARSA
jgi:hypothetical protein